MTENDTRLAGKAGREALAAELATANHILAFHGVVDAFGHVSLRCPWDAERMLIARSMAPALVQAEDILELDIATSTPIAPTPHGTYLERFIHSEIYKSRPDAAAIVHSHAAPLIPFGASETPLLPVYHMGGFLGAGVPIFEIRGTGGDETDMLIRSPALGAALAARLGDHAVVLMRGHGATVVGASLHQAVFRAVYAQLNAELLARALQLGPVTCLNPAEAANAAATNDGQAGRAWEVWKLQCERMSARG